MNSVDNRTELRQVVSFILFSVIYFITHIFLEAKESFKYAFLVTIGWIIFDYLKTKNKTEKGDSKKMNHTIDNRSAYKTIRNVRLAESDFISYWKSTHNLPLAHAVVKFYKELYKQGDYSSLDVLHDINWSIERVTYETIDRIDASQILSILDKSNVVEGYKYNSEELIMYNAFVSHLQDVAVGKGNSSELRKKLLLRAKERNQKPTQDISIKKSNKFQPSIKLEDHSGLISLLDSIMFNTKHTNDGPIVINALFNYVDHGDIYPLFIKDDDVAVPEFKDHVLQEFGSVNWQDYNIEPIKLVYEKYKGNSEVIGYIKRKSCAYVMGDD